VGLDLWGDCHNLNSTVSEALVPDLFHVFLLYKDKSGRNGSLQIALKRVQGASLAEQDRKGQLISLELVGPGIKNGNFSRLFKTQQKVLLLDRCECSFLVTDENFG
jgi:hypothetical protein